MTMALGITVCSDNSDDDITMRGLKKVEKEVDNEIEKHFYETSQ